MGKSTIAKLFYNLGLPVHDSDKEIKFILDNDLKIQKQIKRIWPSCFKNNYLDKETLSKIIFKNNNERVRLEKMLHPIVNKRKNFFISKNKDKRILIFDVPLLFETKQENQYDYIFLAVCSYKTQFKRAVLMRGISKDVFENICKSQMSVQQKKSKKPIVINTDKSIIYNNIYIVMILIKIYFVSKLHGIKKIISA